MKQHKILVIGSPGSGKSTFSRKLRDKMGLPLYYLDMIYHKPDRTTVTQEEFDEKLSHMSVGICLAVTYPPKKGCFMLERKVFLRIFVREW